MVLDHGVGCLCVPDDPCHSPVQFADRNYLTLNEIKQPIELRRSLLRKRSDMSALANAKVREIHDAREKLRANWLDPLVQWFVASAISQGSVGRGRAQEQTCRKAVPLADGMW